MAIHFHEALQPGLPHFGNLLLGLDMGSGQVCQTPDVAKDHVLSLSTPQTWNNESPQPNKDSYPFEGAYVGFYFLSSRMVHVGALEEQASLHPHVAGPEILVVAVLIGFATWILVAVKYSDALA